MRAALRALPRHRRRAESLMVDVVKVERLAGRVRDPVTLEDVESFEVVYQGSGKIQAYEGQYEQSSVAGGANYVQSRSYLHVPIDAGPFEQGDRVTVGYVATAYGELPYGEGAYGGVAGGAFDSSRIGQVFLIEAATGKSLATAQRLPVTLREAVS